MGLIHRAIIAIALVAAAVLAVRGFFGSRITQAGVQQAFGSQRLNVLLLGYQEDEGNSDTIVLAHLDLTQHTATLVSIPRDSWVAIPGHGHEKINAAIGYGGPKLAARVVSSLVGEPIDATLAVRPESAKQIVDAMGGLNVKVDEDMDYDDYHGNLHIHLKKGEQYLTGGQVLQYTRFRHDASSDWGRVRRQQQVIKEIVKQMSLPAHWAKLPHVLDIAHNNMKTNLTQQQLLALLQVYRGVPDDNIRSFTMPARAGWVGPESVVFLEPHWTKLIGRMLFSKSDPPQGEVQVANATGNAHFNRTIVAALRGGGWNVRTFVDEPVKRSTSVMGTGPAASALAAIFGAPVVATNANLITLRVGQDIAPDIDL